MNKYYAIFAVLLFGATAEAQTRAYPRNPYQGDGGTPAMAVQKTVGGALASDNQWTPLQTDEDGNLRIAGTISLSFSGGTSDATKLEDTPHSSGDRGDYILGEVRATLSATAADGDYGSFKLDPKGALWNRISVDSGMVGAEDNAITGGTYGFLSLLQRQDVPTTDSTTDGDAGYFKSDLTGKLWVNPWLGTEASYDTLATMAFGSVTASYTTLLTNSNPMKRLDLTNDTDVVVLISFDASTNHQYILPYGSLTIDFQRMGLKESSNVSVKYSAGAPTLGTIYATALY